MPPPKPLAALFEVIAILPPMVSDSAVQMPPPSPVVAVFSATDMVPSVTTDPAEI